MRRSCIVVLTLACAGAPARNAPRGDERAIVDTELDRVAALRRGDCARQAEILDDDFVEITAEGTRTKADNLGNCTSRAVHFDRYDVEDLRVRVYGDAAVLTGEAWLSGTLREVPFARHTRYSRVYVRRGLVWRCVAAQGTPIASR